MDSFIYSPLLGKKYRGEQYTNMMHVSDWMPTILALANISYSPGSDHLFDGVSHADAFFDFDIVPRDFLLYNVYTSVDDHMFDIWLNAPLAIRDSTYKLIHAYSGTSMSDWEYPEEIIDDDKSLNVGTCDQITSLDGNYTLMLFDLDADPYETNNLYYDNDYKTIKVRTD